MCGLSDRLLIESLFGMHSSYDIAIGILLFGILIWYLITLLGY
jgi:hypothetical protein